jgi:5-methylcytosine-specific restriction endonuclease McrA
MRSDDAEAREGEVPQVPVIRRRDRVAEILADHAVAEKQARAIRSKRDRRWRVNRARVLKRDNHTCRMCDWDRCLEVHHVVPVSKGGRDVIANLITLCPNHHALADRGFILQDEMERALARRTFQGRRIERDQMLTQIAKELAATGGDRNGLAQIWARLRLELPQRFAAMHGSKCISASRDSFPPLPPSFFD